MKNDETSSNFLTFLESGRIKITCDGVPVLNFEVTKDSRIVDIIDIPIKISKKTGLIRKLSQAKDLAKKLKNDNITLELRLRGETVLKLGEMANPKFARIVTLSNGIEITDLKKLKKLGEMF